ncbi:MAG: hypothetical protein K2O18_09685, partial [Oscillospiraceae bacterium]|nr:hypothetical protein [Oscillospiraceae bacterium]
GLPVQCRWLFPFFRASCDNWNFNASNPCVYVGGNYNQNGNYGLFYLNYNTASNSGSNIGSRVLLSLANNPPQHGTGSRAPLGGDKR